MGRVKWQDTDLEEKTKITKPKKDFEQRTKCECEGLDSGFEKENAEGPE